MKNARMLQNLDKIISIISLNLITGLLLMVSSSVIAEPDALALSQAGEQFYQSGQYEDAIEAFKKAVEIEPENAEYHHWLGKSYGQLASQSGIFKAYSLSKKTKEQFERAVELDDSDVDALADLLKYYEQAPVFLGGGAEKAEKIRRRLKELNYNEFEKPDV